jgi:hypothetical protein
MDVPQVQNLKCHIMKMKGKAAMLVG